MDLYHKWDVKNYFAYVRQFFSLIFDSLGSVFFIYAAQNWVNKSHWPIGQFYFFDKQEVFFDKS